VVDDGSTDETKDILRPYFNKISYLYQENQGASAARNKGILNAKGEYIAFLDSDDMWVPEKLTKQVTVLENNSDVGMVYSNINHCDIAGNFIKKAYKDKLFQSGFIPEKVLLWKVNCGHPPTWLIRKKCFDEIGLLDTSFKMSEDREFSVRIALNYKIYGLKEPLTWVRIHNPDQRLGRSPAAERERYYFKFLDLLFQQHGRQPCVYRNKKKLLAGYYWYAGKAYLRDKDRKTARNRFWRSIRHYPFQLKSYIYLIPVSFGEPLFRLILNIRLLLNNWIRSLKKMAASK